MASSLDGSDEHIIGGHRYRIVQLNKNCFAVQERRFFLLFFQYWGHAHWAFDVYDSSELYEESREDALAWITEIERRSSRKPYGHFG